MATKKQIVTEALIDFCARVEQEAYPLTVCKVTHPDAIEGDVYEGTFAGYRLSKGDVAEALVSDGSFIPPRPAKALKNDEQPEPQPEQAPEGGAA